MPQESFPHLNDDNTKTALIDGDAKHSYAAVTRRIDRFASGLRPDFTFAHGVVSSVDIDKLAVGLFIQQLRINTSKLVNTDAKRSCPNGGGQDVRR